MNVFDKAKPKPQNKKSTKKDDNIIIVDNDEVSDAIDDFIRSQAIAKEANADATVAKGVIEPYALENYVKMMYDKGSKPSTIKFKTPDREDEEGNVTDGGNIVSHIIQDRGPKVINEDQEASLRAIMGDNIDNYISEEDTYSFNTDILYKDGVADAIGAAISRSLKKLVKDGIVTQDEADSVISVESTRVLSKGLVDDLLKVAKIAYEAGDNGEDTEEDSAENIKQIMCDIADISTSITKYVKT